MNKSVSELKFYEGNEELFPQQDFDEYNGLKEDIRKNGIKTELHVTPDGVVLCGNQRLRIARELGIEELPIKVVNPLDREEYVVKDNLLRRHLSNEQKAGLFSYLAKKYEGRQGRPKNSDNLSLIIEEKGKTAEILAEEVYGDKKKARSVERYLQYAKITENKPELLGKPLSVAIRQDKADKLRVMAAQVKERVISDDINYQNADALTYLAGLEDKSVDLVIIDPPYNIDFKSSTAQGSNDFSDNIDYEELDKIFSELNRVMDEDTHIYCFAGFQTIDKFKNIFEKYFNFNNLLIWLKQNHTNTNYQYYYGHKYELIMFGSKGKRILNEFSTDVLEVNNLVNKTHAAQKPEALIKKLIRMSSGEGQIVLDCFAGSGSTLKAAISMNRRAYGCELDHNHYAISYKQLMEVKNGD